MQIGFREKAILELGGKEHTDADSYLTALANGEIKHPLLASLRVRVKKTDTEKNDNGTNDNPPYNLILLIPNLTAPVLHLTNIRRFSDLEFKIL